MWQQNDEEDGPTLPGQSRPEPGVIVWRHDMAPPARNNTIYLVDGNAVIVGDTTDCNTDYCVRNSDEWAWQTNADILEIRARRPPLAETAGGVPRSAPVYTRRQHGTTWWGACLKKAGGVRCLNSQVLPSPGTQTPPKAVRSP